MATTYDKASLVMIPSGYKDDKLYSVKPTDGSGDFTFSRDGSGASPATRVNASGLIEKGRENVLLQSNNFGTTWITSSSSVTGGQTGYDGSSDAWLFDSTSGYIYQSISASGVHTLSLYVKAGTALGFRLRVDQATDANYIIDLSDGSLVSEGGNISYKSTSVGGGWFRMEMAFVADTITNIQFRVTDLAGTTSSGTAYIQDAQLEQGLVATDYIETTTSAVSAGLLGDMPRLDYSGGATCPSLLLEPSRVNVVEYAEYFDIYTKSNATITNNSDQSPEGLQNASSLVGNGATSSHYIFRNSGTAVSGTDYTISFFAKSGSLDYVQLVMGSGAFGVMHQNFDLSNGTIGSSSGSVTPFIESYANNWYRVGVTITATASTTITPFIALANSSTMSRLASFATSDDVKIYGLQVETGSYPTSYIPTYGSASTRGVDEMDTTYSTAITTDGSVTFFLELDDAPRSAANSTGANFAQDFVSTDFITYNHTGAGLHRIRVNANGSAYYIATSIFQDEPVKIAAVATASSVSVYANGELVNTLSIVGDWTTAGAFYTSITDSVGILPVKQYILFPTALTSSEAIALTTL